MKAYLIFKEGEQDYDLCYEPELIDAYSTEARAVERLMRHLAATVYQKEVDRTIRLRNNAIKKNFKTVEKHVITPFEEWWQKIEQFSDPENELGKHYLNYYITPVEIKD